jgi:hypothetical protein
MFPKTQLSRKFWPAKKNHEERRTPAPKTTIDQMSDAGTSSTSSTPHAMKGAAEDITYPLSPSGDLTLVITNTAEPDRQRILFASSQVLMESSRYFAAMLNPAYGFAEFQTRRINFIDDDFTALMIVLRAMHKQDDLLGAVSISLDILERVDVVCDKYGLADCRAVTRWARNCMYYLMIWDEGFANWSRKRFGREPIKLFKTPPGGLRRLERLLRVAWGFKSSYVFRAATMSLFFFFEFPLTDEMALFNEFQGLEFEGLPDSIRSMPPTHTAPRKNQ